MIAHFLAYLVLGIVGMLLFCIVYAAEQRRYSARTNLIVAVFFTGVYFVAIAVITGPVQCNL